MRNIVNLKRFLFYHKYVLLVIRVFTVVFFMEYLQCEINIYRISFVYSNRCISLSNGTGSLSTDSGVTRR